MPNLNDSLGVIESYPGSAAAALHELRRLVLEVAEELGIADLVETIKWGEPSFVCKTGTPLRIDWKPKYPDQVSMFVNCQSQLIATAKEVYPGLLRTIGKREIALPVAQPWPVEPLKHFISLTLTYHNVKHLPLLGA